MMSALRTKLILYLGVTLSLVIISAVLGMQVGASLS